MIRTATSFTLLLVPLLMVLGLAAPVIGPAIDHHYADRSPNHAHAFVGEATNEHLHLLTGHDHEQGVQGDGVSVVSTSATSPDGPLTLDGATLESLVPDFDDHMTAVDLGSPRAPDTEAVAPLDPPPRRA
ncbi:MAG: hypothetical protein QF357_02435 [Dehalococcoidia bacterium]|nr:hypothetical protein [Dehalococcoidia bacterium]